VLQKDVTNDVDAFESDADALVLPVHSKSDKCLLYDLQSEGCALVASLRGSSTVPYSVIPKIVDACDSMTSMTVDSIHQSTLDVLRDCGVSGNILSNVSVALQHQSDTLNHPLNIFSTKYKQDQ